MILNKPWGYTVYYILQIQLIAGPWIACLCDNVEPPRDACAQTTQRWSSMMDKVDQQRYVMLHLSMQSKLYFPLSLLRLVLFDYRMLFLLLLWLLNCLLFYQGTHHLWSVPALSFQDVTYHFRVSLSVSKNIWGAQTLSTVFGSTGFLL